MASKRTTIHGDNVCGGQLHVDYDTEHKETVFLHLSSGNFSYCAGLNSAEARVMAEALLKAAFAIEAAAPVAA
jgi:hypothetical protein